MSVTLPAMAYGCQTWSATKALVKKLETSQRAMERKLLNVKLKDRIRITIIRQRTRVTDIVQYVTNTKLKWAGHIARMKGDRWTMRSTEWQIKGVRSSGRAKRRWRHDGATGIGMDKDSKGQRKLEDTGGRLLPAVEGHSLKQNKIE